MQQTSACKNISVCNVRILSCTSKVKSSRTHHKNPFRAFVHQPTHPDDRVPSDKFLWFCSKVLTAGNVVQWVSALTDQNTSVSRSCPVFIPQMCDVNHNKVPCPVRLFSRFDVIVLSRVVTNRKPCKRSRLSYECVLSMHAAWFPGLSRILSFECL